jgi:hypothetical protein
MTRTIAIVASLLVAGCSPTVIDSYCLNVKPITYSAAGDTAETKAQIKEHNAVYDRLCK